MGKGGIPDRWLDYSNFGTKIDKTRFVALKVPLNENLCRRAPKTKEWTPSMALRDIKGLGMVVDLTNTARYYEPKVFRDHNVQHLKLRCEGRGYLPDAGIIDQFFSGVDKFLQDGSRKGQVIGVHCTHGLNRTGFFVCMYMIDRMGFSPQQAIAAFNSARGHPIERQEYLEALARGKGNFLSCPEKSTSGEQLNDHKYFSEEHHRSRDFKTHMGIDPLDSGAHRVGRGRSRKELFQGDNKTYDHASRGEPSKGHHGTYFGNGGPEMYSFASRPFAYQRSHSLDHLQKQENSSGRTRDSSARSVQQSTMFDESWTDKGTSSVPGHRFNTIPGRASERSSFYDAGTGRSSPYRREERHDRNYDQSGFQYANRAREERYDRTREQTFRDSDCYVERNNPSYRRPYRSYRIHR